jgi:hypothetical protein
MVEIAADIFISYTRADLDFVRRLHDALAQQGKKIAVDWEIRAGQEFQKALDAAIEAANAYLFVISPESVFAPGCLHELEHALEHEKSILPILFRQVPSENLPPALANRKWIDFRESDKFDSALAELLRAIDPTAQQVVQPEEEAQKIFVTIQALSPGSSTPDVLSVTPALARLLARATRLNQQYEKEFDLTFSSMLLAFLASDDPLSLWFKDYVKEIGIALDELLKIRKLDPAALERIAAQPVSEQELQRPWRQTSSAKSLFTAAQEICRTITPSNLDAPLDVRHLMATYIYRPAGHESDLESLRFKRPAWSNAFLGQMVQWFPTELEYWKAMHRQTFNSEPQVVEGPSTHVATDMWTLNDSLGYHAYAHAISRFMTHPRTKPPLTISIQAPWGGGKTSLMRMIQQKLDPEALPGALKEVKQKDDQPDDKFTVKQVLQEIEEWSQTSTKKKLPKIPEDNKCKLLTIWFNAWKYESTNQVWAGLADTIIQQVAARLSPVNRELFWLHLNLNRVDADKIRQRIYEQIFRYFWRGMRVWVLGLGGALLVSVMTTLMGWVTKQDAAQSLGWGGLGFSILLGAGVTVLKFRQAQKSVKEEPANVSLSEFLAIPDYSAELGFIHQVEADLQRVFASIPQEYRPLVIFVDDLDRCSPAKVAQVVEAVNLFLAGEFPNCMFVMGMDTEMVAAALQAAHKDMIACLPVDAGIPVGWRFMDKFVQLPFLIPPAEEPDLRRYTTMLFSADKEKAADPQVNQIARRAAERIHTRTAVVKETEQLQKAHNLNEAQTTQLHNQLEAEVVRRKLDEGIEKFTDENPELRRVVAAATAYFPGNPRELKRFINAFRFQYFLWWARRAQDLPGPTLEQLLRWTVFSMRWPEVLRWLRRSSGNEWRAQKMGAAAPTVSNRLKLIENISSQATDLAMWHKHAKESLRLTPDTTPWLNDDDLLEFFHNEGKRPEGERLSSGEGKGLW